VIFRINLGINFGSFAYSAFSVSARRRQLLEGNFGLFWAAIS
jgi:hypothetical protein